MKGSNVQVCSSCIDFFDLFMSSIFCQTVGDSLDRLTWPKISRNEHTAMDIVSSYANNNRW